MTTNHLVPKLFRHSENLPERRDPYTPLHDFQRQMNRLFDDYFGDFPLARRGDEPGLAIAGFVPRVDVSETDHEVKVSAELPGMDEKNIAVEITDTVLAIHGERRAEKEEKGRNWHAREQTYGAFHRTIPLPTSVDGKKAKAKFVQGLLTVTVPKREEEQADRKTIKIETD